MSLTKISLKKISLKKISLTKFLKKKSSEICFTKNNFLQIFLKDIRKKFQMPFRKIVQTDFWI